MRAHDVTAMQDRDPGIIYTAPSGGGVYHTTRDCPNVAPGFLVHEESDPRAKRARFERDECMWCRYDTDDPLDLD